MSPKTGPPDPFLEDDYEVPKRAGKFMKFAIGENRFRILDKPLLGYSGWKTGDDKKICVRKPTDDFAPGELDPKEQSKHFWALPVWNYALGIVQVLEITQSTVQDAITNLNRNKKWGRPTEYDIVVTAVGEKLKREYSIIPDPKEPLAADAVEAWTALQGTFDIQRLWTGGDPFGENGDTAEPDTDDDIPF